jgi:hypothetical protein
MVRFRCLPGRAHRQCEAFPRRHGKSIGLASPRLLRPTYAGEDVKKPHPASQFLLRNIVLTTDQECPIPPDSCGAWWNRLTSCGFPQRKPHTRPWVVPRRGIRVSDPFLVRCGIPLRSTRHLFAFVDTPSLDASLGRTVEVRGIPHLAQSARSDMGHPRPVVRTVFPEWDRKGFFTPSSGGICSFCSRSQYRCQRTHFTSRGMTTASDGGFSRLVNSDQPLRGNQEKQRGPGPCL